jgi:hypothetical protein
LIADKGFGTGNVRLYQIEVRAISEQHDVLAQQVAREIFQLPGGQLLSLTAIAASTTPLAILTTQIYYLTKKLTWQLLIDHVITGILAESVLAGAFMRSITGLYFSIITYVGHSCVSLRLSSS